MFNDNVLRAYVDRIFSIYDRRRLNSLQTHEITNYVNDSLAQQNSPKRYDPIEMFYSIKQIEPTFYGRVGRKEFLHGLKKMLKLDWGNLGSMQPSFNTRGGGNGHDDFGVNTYEIRTPLTPINVLLYNIQPQNIYPQNHIDSRSINYSQQYRHTAMNIHKTNLAKSVASRPKSTGHYSIPRIFHHEHITPNHDWPWRSHGLVAHN